MKKIINILLIILSAPYLFAQNGQISGKVLESSSLPISYVTISLKENSDKTISTGITDDKGVFILDNIPAGNYTITYSLLAYKTIIKPIVLKPNEIVNVGTITMESDTKLLEEVTITGQRSSVSLKLDKKVFEVGKDVLSQSGVVTDLLNIVPSVSVSPSGAISLRGNSNVLVLIDGRRTGLTQGNALEQVPADQVERVEVITNPSSRFDAAGLSRDHQYHP